MVASKLKALWNDESAQGATEYILILVFIVSVAMIFGDKIKAAVKAKMADLGDGIGNVKIDPN